MSTFASLVSKLYDSLLRPLLPYKISVHNGVPVRARTKLFDFTDVFPEYEQPLIKAVRRHVKEEDKVVVVGGGIGVSTVAAARTTGIDGKVVTYEGSRSQYETVQQTIEINRVQDQVELNHTVVGSYSEFSEEGWGTPSDATVMAPDNLPSSDVLEMDCEGAEQEILAEMEIKPRTIIVETHGFLGSSKDAVTTLLEDAGYEITNSEQLDRERGIDVITATYSA